MAQLAFSFDNNVTPISEHGARIGRRYPKISDAPGKRLGLQGGDQNRGVGVDYFTNAAARMGWGTPSLTEATEYDLVRLSYNYWLLITLYRNHWISRRIVDVPAQDMVRAWPKITSDIDPKDLTKIDQAIRRTNTKSNILKTLKWARLFGGAGALIVIDGQEDMLEEPLDIESVGIGAFRGIIPFDRWAGITNSGEVSTDITKPLEFNLPEWYDVQAPNGADHFRVHSSRILRFCGPSVPTPEYEAQQYWGISSLEPTYEAIRMRDNVVWNIVSLSFRANIIGMKFPELAQALSGLGMNQNALVQFQSRMQQVNELMSNNSLMMLPKDGEMSSVNYSFAGMADVLQQFQLEVAGAAQIPVTRLFGRTLSGLGQSNEQDERVYEEFISLEQDDQMRPQLDRLYPVVCMSTLGEVPDDLDLLFPTVRVLDHKEKAELAKSVSENIVSLFGAGIITRPMALKEIKQSSDITEVGTNITDLDISEAEAQEKITPTLQLETSAEGEELQTGTKGASQDNAEFIDLDFGGLPITIEVQAGDRRTILNSTGDIVYNKLLRNDYGYIRDTVGRDGDEIDVILGPYEKSPNVFIADMEDLGSDVFARCDEDKVLIGFKTQVDAERAFKLMYPPSFLRSIEAIPMAQFLEQIQLTKAV